MQHLGKHICEIRGLSFTYDGSDKPALTDIDLTLSPHELSLLVGPTGCGKTTLALSMNGLIPNIVRGTMSGSVLVLGLDTRQHAVCELATRAGVLFQDPEAQICHLYAEDEIAFGCENLGIDREEIHKRVRSVSELLGINGILTTPVHTLSVGQKQRIALASVLAMEPSLLILDEPLSNLDAKTSADFVAALDEMRYVRNMCILVIEHRFDELIGVADRVVLLDAGGITLSASPRELARECLSPGATPFRGRHPELWVLARKLNERGIEMSECPLTVEEAYAGLSTSRLRFSPQKVAKPRGNGSLILELQDISFRYHDTGFAIENASFGVQRGEAVALVGPNGSGKTTLAEIVVGLLKPSSGRILFGATDASRVPAHRRSRTIGYVFQEPDTHFVKERVADELAFSCRSWGFGPQEAAKRTNELLRAFRLSEFRNSMVYELSMGQKKSLSIASVLQLGQQVLILDEPTMGLDWESASTLMALLRRLSEENGLALIILTHSLRLLVEACERVVGIREGRIVHDGSIHNLFSDKELLQSLALVEPPIWRLSSLLHHTEGIAIRPALTVSEFLEQVGRHA